LQEKNYRNWLENSIEYWDWVSARHDSQRLLTNKFKGWSRSTYCSIIAGGENWEEWSNIFTSWTVKSMQVIKIFLATKSHKWHLELCKVWLPPVVYPGCIFFNVIILAEMLIRSCKFILAWSCQELRYAFAKIFFHDLKKLFSARCTVPISVKIKR
jgi:hypothetical protein